MSHLTLYAIIFALVCTAALFVKLIPPPPDCSAAAEIGMVRGETKGIRETTELFAGGANGNP